MNKLIGTVMVIAVVALLPSCGNSHTPTGPVPFGVVSVNAVGWSGNVETGNLRIFFLGGITQGNTYLVRTVIAPGGTLRGAIYRSYTDYRAAQAPLTTLQATVPDYYEANFTGQGSFDHLLVLSGTPAPSADGVLNFYDLRLLSASGKELKFLTASTPSTEFTVTGLVRVEEFSAISGTTVTDGSYTVLLTSSTFTISHPQMFIYSNPTQSPTLSLSTLLYSAIAATVGTERKFLISNFTSNPTLSTFASNSYFSTQCAVTGVTFTSGTGTGSGPFIMVKGVSRATYTLTVSP